MPRNKCSPIGPSNITTTTTTKNALVEKVQKSQYGYLPSVEYISFDSVAIPVKITNPQPSNQRVYSRVPFYYTDVLAKV